MNLNKLKLKLMLAGALLAASSAQATVYTYNYTVVLDSIYKHEEGDFEDVALTSTNMTGSPLAVGNVVHGQFFYDTEAPHVGDDSPPISAKEYYGLHTGVNATFEPSGHSVLHRIERENSAERLYVLNNVNFQKDELYFSDGWATGSDGERVVLSFIDPSGLALSNAAVPGGPLNLDAFAEKSFAYYYDTNYSYTRVWTFGHFTSIELAGGPPPVPEPATYGMLLAGLGLLGIAARRKRHQQ